MKIIPMIFNQQMVQALTEGRKTVTRRPMKIQPKKNGGFWEFPWGAATTLDYFPIMPGHATANAAPCKIGDLIWVRETFCVGRFDELDAEHPDDRSLIIEQCFGDNNYIAKQFAVSEGVTELDEVKWKPSIHMPRKASRLTLRVTYVRCERVQNITEAQARFEGVFPASPSSLAMPYYVSFMDLWEDLYKNWCKNPWVWVIEFDVIKQNVDSVK